MKTAKSTILLLLAMSAILPAPQAKAAYVTETVEVCEDEELWTGAGVVLGGLGFAAAGWFLGGKNPWIATGAGLGGAALGGFIGNQISCEQRRTYYGHLMTHMASPDFRRPYEAPGCRIVVTREGYARWGEYCRTYRMDYTDRRGRWVEDERTTCLDRRGRWRVGYDSDAIERVIWTNYGPAYRETNYHPRWEYRTEYEYGRYHPRQQRREYVPAGYARAPRRNNCQ